MTLLSTCSKKQCLHQASFILNTFKQSRIRKVSILRKMSGIPYEQKPLSVDDPEIDQLIKAEKKRQTTSLELIASENFISRPVLEAIGSCLTNKYSAGFPGNRHYPSNENIDQIESICQKRALDLFNLDAKVWGVNVQPYSGSSANMAVFMGLLNPHERVMGLDAYQGGHSTHGSTNREDSATAKFFETMSYNLNAKTDMIDYDSLLTNARLFRPKVIVAGTSAYTRLLDYQKFREICDDVGAVLLGDMAHISGMVAAQLLPSPFTYCDIVTSTTHKTLRGPRAGLIFFRKELKEKSNRTSYNNLEAKINCGVYPIVQGGPHNNTVAALAVALRQAKTAEYRQYQEQVLKNAQTLVKALKNKGYEIITGGTDLHMVIVDLRPYNILGEWVEIVCKMAAINLNHIPCPREKAGEPATGIRIGSPALTTRQLKEKDFEHVVELLHKGVQIALKAKKLSGHTTLKDFERYINEDEAIKHEIKALKYEVEQLMSTFPMPG